MTFEPIVYKEPDPKADEPSIVLPVPYINISRSPNKIELTLSEALRLRDILVHMLGPSETSTHTFRSTKR